MFDIYNPYFVDKKIVIYGAGRYGRHCYEKVKGLCSIIAWVDKNYKTCDNYNGYCITSTLLLADEIFDYVYVAIGNDVVFFQAFKELISLGISEEKIVG